MKTETCSPAEIIQNLREFRVHQSVILSGHTHDGKQFSGEWTNYWPAMHLDPPGRIELYAQDTGETSMIWVKDIRDVEHTAPRDLPVHKAPRKEAPPSHLGYFSGRPPHQHN